ncbi:Ca-activated chloride channel family protein [Trueperella bonasi]|uniref:Ca-activated chloride channel family protein n=1 Tax=Trueperella bonasi TaxID=312286 RepID=A0ABT9NGG1_9ACTO|nr:vWA domain-containing protein [Trueperella bonasi]MDP9806494.1 Ca-activated chloride channel family protein [Trueperella bonasi]
MNFQFLIPAWLLAAIGVFGTIFIVLGAIKDRRRILAWLRRAGMLLAVIAMGLAPATQLTVTTSTSNLAVYFVIDATGSMAAEDYGPDRQPRVEGVRADALALMEELPSAHYAIIEYSSTASQQLPLTSDKNAVATWLEVYDREPTDYSGGSSMNRPVELVAEIVGRQTDPTQVPIIVLMTDGESTDTSSSSRDEQPDFSSWKGLFQGGMVLGYGTEEGGRMLKHHLWSQDEEYIRDPAGGDAISRIDINALNTVAQQIGVPFFHRTAPGGMEEIAETIGAQALLSQSDEQQTYSPTIWPCATVFALLTAWEIAHLIPQVRSAGMFATRRPGRQGRT